jgi:hypothetical protein
VTTPSAVSSADWSRNDDERARDLVEVYGLGAAAVARDKARTAACAGRLAEGRNWLQLVDLIQRRLRAPPVASDA